MNKKRRVGAAVQLLVVVVVLGLTADSVVAAEVFPISRLDVSQVLQDSGRARANKSFGGHALTLGGQTFTNGLGTHTRSEFVINVKGQAEKFTAQAGVDDEVGKGHGNARFSVFGDGRLLWQSDLQHGGGAPQPVIVGLDGVKYLVLIVNSDLSGNAFNHADWVNAEIIMRTGAPEAVTLQEPAVILTPKPSPLPRINGAKVFGVRPGSPFLFTIPATGDRPMTFSVDELPAGLYLDAQTGRIAGKLEKQGNYIVTLHAKNSLGATQEKFKIICGSQIGLTPAMGWNSWLCFRQTVTAEKVKAQAAVMVSSGLINHGWTYINLDGFWTVNPHSQYTNDVTLQGPERDYLGRIQPNPRFPDIQMLADDIHSLGLKLGLYSNPGPWSCSGQVGSFDHELLDAQQFAQWGVDYLKYDWCTYDPALESSRKLSKDFVATLTNQIDSFPQEWRKYMQPYAIMRAALDQQPRDIVYSLCLGCWGDEYRVWQWGAQVGANSWRTSCDIGDTWNSMSRGGFSEAGMEKHAGPGHFNDPDMLTVGQLGGKKLRPTRLTPNEQYTQISLWCLLAAPLLLSCDLTQLDPFTLSLLSNDEVLAVDQDPLGQQARCLTVNGKLKVWNKDVAPGALLEKSPPNGELQVWVKDMEDGSKAVGFFNCGATPATVSVKWSELGRSGVHRVRDLWRQQNLGEFRDLYSATVPRHGVELVQIW